MFNNVLRPVARNLVRSGNRFASGYGHSKAVDIKVATINDIPQSCGTWKEHYDSRQKVYNAQLIGGLALLVGTITYIKVSGVIFFNYGPPEEPVESK